MKTPTLLLAFLALLISSIVHAQRRVAVSGQVYDATTQEPLVGANVYSLSDRPHGTSANESGHFTLSAAPDDTLMVTFVGYREQLIPMAAGASPLIIRLSPFAQDMQAVTVEATSLVAEEFSVKKIEQLEIYTNPNAKADPLLAVNALPASTTLDESASISLRGSSPAETGIFLNDVPVYDAVRFAQLNGIGTFSIFNTSLIQQLQVFPSNPPLEFGNTSAGLISLKTVERIPEQASGSVILSPASLGLNADMPVGSAAGLSLFSNYKPSGLLQALNPRSLQDLKYFNTLDFGAHYVHNLGSRSQLKVFNYAVTEGYRFASRHPSGDDVFRQRKQRNFTVAHYQTRYERALLTLNGGFSASRMHLAIGNLDLTLRNRDVYGSANYTRFWSAWTLKTGFTYDGRRATAEGQAPTHDYARAAQHPAYTFQNTSTARVPEGYVYGKYEPTPRWTLGGGLRKNVPLTGQQSYLSYQFNTHYQWTNGQSLTLSSGRYHQYVIPQSDETNNFYRSDQFSLDYRYQKSGRAITAATFYKHVRRGEVQDRVYGAEVAADVRWSSKLRTQASYTYLNATVHRAETSYASPYDLNYFVRGSISYQLAPQWTLNTLFLHRQGTYYTPVVDRRWEADLAVYQPFYASEDQALRLPDYNTVDLSVSRLWPLSGTWSAVAFGSINNLLNHKNVRDVNYNADYSESFQELFSQRTIYFGVVLQWR